MGDKFKNLIKTAGQENAEAEEQYQELYKVGTIIGEGFMDVVTDKEAGVGKALKGGAKYVGGKAKATGKYLKAKAKGGTKYVGGKAKATKKYVGGKAKQVDVKAQALGQKVYKKSPLKGKAGAMSKKKKRIYGYGAAGAGAGVVGGAAYGVGKNYKVTKRASDDDVKTASDLILRRQATEEE